MRAAGHHRSAIMGLLECDHGSLSAPAAGVTTGGADPFDEVPAAIKSLAMIAARRCLKRRGVLRSVTMAIKSEAGVTTSAAESRSRAGLPIIGGVLVAALLCSCATELAALNPFAAGKEPTVDHICADTMALDVAGPYYPSCKDYLSRHVRAPAPNAGITPDRGSESSEHKACLQIGLARDTPEYKSCVQEMYQLDLGARHF
jgi:hypothetical protein